MVMSKDDNDSSGKQDDQYCHFYLFQYFFTKLTFLCHVCFQFLFLIVLALGSEKPQLQSSSHKIGSFRYLSLCPKHKITLFCQLCNHLGSTKKQWQQMARKLVCGFVLVLGKKRVKCLF